MVTAKTRIESDKSKEIDIVDISLNKSKTYVIYTFSNGKKYKEELFDRSLFDSDKDYEYYINSITNKK